MSTERIAYRAEGANVYRQDGTLVCIAVDPLDAEVIAGALQWKVAVHEPEPTPKPFPTAAFVVAEGQVWARYDTIKRWYYVNSNDATRDADADPFRGPAVPAGIHALAEWEEWATITRAHAHHTARYCEACKLLAATDALGLDR